MVTFEASKTRFYKGWGRSDPALKLIVLILLDCLVTSPPCVWLFQKQSGIDVGYFVNNFYILCGIDGRFFVYMGLLWFVIAIL